VDGWRLDRGKLAKMPMKCIVTGQAAAYSLPARIAQSYNRGMKKTPLKALSYSVFYEQDSDGGFVAFVPALPGCHTQGETLEETEQNVKEAISLYLESLVAHKEPIPVEGRSFQGRVTVPLSIPA